MQTRLYRSRRNRWLAGVCGGLGQYLRIDANLVRVFFILFAFGTTGWFGLFVYGVLWIALPLEDRESEPFNLNERFAEMGRDLNEAVRGSGQRVASVVGIALIVLGVVYLVQNLGIPWLNWFRFAILWPVLLILAGIALIVRRARRE